jgi:bacillolysin
MNPSRLFGMLLAVFLLLGAAPVGGAHEPGWTPSPDSRTLLAQLRQSSGGALRVSYHAATGRVRFIGADPDRPIPRMRGLTAGVEPEQAARAFLGAYGRLFGLSDPRSELVLARTRAADRGRSFVRFQQVYRGIPVLGGELIVQVDSRGNVVSANGEVAPDLEVDALPSVEAALAEDIARQAVAKGRELEPGDLSVAPAELWIYNPVLLGPGRDRSFPVWRTEVSSPARLDIHELVLVDARTGIVALHFNQIDAARYRQIYYNGNDPALGLPGFGPVRSEGEAPYGEADTDNAYDYFGATYDFYWNNHGRDSIDDAGMTMVATVDYCPDATDCPYPNAFWDDELNQMVFGDGYASADDVVAHELTHGVTDYESNLFYYYQSGAINESFSDLWGEFVDLTYTNGNDDDTPGVRWLMGEDIPGGAIRDMADPTVFGDPDRVGSGSYLCGESDGGGVHTNSGVNNKAVFLLTDGGTFNGYTVTGLGITKVALIYYEVQTHLFTSASDYQDLYDALYQACLNLVGSGGITLSDCQEVRDATEATEMDQVACSATHAPLCPVGQAPVQLFFDDLENPGSGNWASGAEVGTDAWSYPQNPNPLGWLDATYATSGVTNLYGYDQPATADYAIAMTSDVVLPAGSSPFLHLEHSYDFEVYLGRTYDGGVLEYSTNGGTSWIDAGSLFTHNGYSGSIYNVNTSNPLAGRNAFVGASTGYLSSRLDLGTLAGQSVRFRFRIGTDSTGNDYGWFVDDVRIYTCAPPTWVGNVSAAWSDPGNWNTGAPPSCATDAIVPTAPAGGRFPILDADAEVGNLTVQTGALLTMTAHSLGVCGDWLVEGTGRFDGTGGTVVFKGGSQTIDMTAGTKGQFFDLQIGDGAGSPVVAANSDLDVDGDLTISSGATLGGGSFTHRIAGNWDSQGTYDPGTSLVVFDGGTVQTAAGVRTVSATFNATGLPVPIPDRACVDSTLDVAVSATLQDVDVTIGQIIHTRDGDLGITIRHPDATEVELSTDNGGNGDNYTSTVFDDEAADSIIDGSAPFNGSFRPEGNLSDLNGKDAAGTWTLHVCDDRNNMVGTLDAWSLSFSFEMPGVDFYGLTAAAGSTVTLNSDAILQGNLVVEAGGLLDVGTHVLDVGGSVTNDGGLRQTRDAPAGSTTAFLNVSTDRYYGVDVYPVSGGMGTTTVTVYGNQTCAGFATAVKRCFEIDPGTLQTATLTFYYRDAEANGQVAPDIWHWSGSAWQQENLDARDLSGVENNWVRVTGVDAYSPFAPADSAPTAVTLAAFGAAVEGEAVVVSWHTVSEIDLAGFNLYRSSSWDGPYAQLNDDLIAAQNPGSLFGATYAWVDRDVTPGATYYYRLDDVGVDGGITLHGPVSVTLFRYLYLPLVLRR